MDQNQAGSDLHGEELDLQKGGRPTIALAPSNDPDAEALSKSPTPLVIEPDDEYELVEPPPSEPSPEKNSTGVVRLIVVIGLLVLGAVVFGSVGLAAYSLTLMQNPTILTSDGFKTIVPNILNSPILSAIVSGIIGIIGTAVGYFLQRRPRQRRKKKQSSGRRIAK